MGRCESASFAMEWSGPRAGFGLGILRFGFGDRGAGSVVDMPGMRALESVRRYVGKWCLAQSSLK